MSKTYNAIKQKIERDEYAGEWAAAQPDHIAIEGYLERNMSHSTATAKTDGLADWEREDLEKTLNNLREGWE